MNRFAILFQLAKIGKNNSIKFKIMFKKGTKLYSIINNKCPQCHEGDFFEESNPYKLKSLFDMHRNCSNCNLKYEIEPSFFQGAMYVSYGLTIALSVATFIISSLFGLDLIKSGIAIFIILILFTPVTFKLARLIYINFFIKYKKKK